LRRDPWPSLLRTAQTAKRGRLVATVRGRLRASEVSLDASDLEACYAQPTTTPGVGDVPEGYHVIPTQQAQRALLTSDL